MERTTLLWGGHFYAIMRGLLYCVERTTILWGGHYYTIMGVLLYCVGWSPSVVGFSCYGQREMPAVIQDFSHEWVSVGFQDVVVRLPRYPAETAAR